jgi:hypothetical protein
MKPTIAGIALLMALLSFAPAGSAQLRRVFPGNQPGPGGVVNLPYMISDNAGSIWRVYPGGWMQQQGNMPSYSQGAMLMVNGQQLGQNNNQGRVDEKTGELILDGIVSNGLSATRHILFDRNDGVLRYIDVLKNTLNQDQTFNVMVQTSLNFGVNNAQLVPDPKKKDQNIAWVAATGAGNCVVEVFNGVNAKTDANISWPLGNNVVQGNYSLLIPAGKEVAIMHLHRIAATADAGMQFVKEIKEAKLLKSVAPALRKLIVNFQTGQGWIGDVEILRGDVLDIVELRSGDQFKGTLKETGFNLQTFYGPVSLQIDQVIGLLSVGQFRPRQLVITSDGQIFGGHLKKETVDIQLSSGQVAQIPLNQISRVGYRKRSGEPEEWKFEKPMVLLRSGERMAIKPPTANLDVVTRYGVLSLKPASIAAVLFQSEEGNVHQVYLTDGSKLSGLLSAGEFEVTLDAGNQSIKFPASAIARLQLSPKTPEVDDVAPTLHLAGDDQLVGTLDGKLDLDTAFDTISVNAAEIKTMTRAKDSVQDVQVALWDGTTLSGQLHQPELAAHLGSGVDIKVPVALLEQYSQPQPQPSASMLERIKIIVADLNSDDWRTRDRAQAALIGMGPVASGVLKELRSGQPPEVQKSIDQVIDKLEQERKKEKSSPASTTPPAVGE